MKKRTKIKIRKIIKLILIIFVIINISYLVTWKNIQDSNKLNDKKNDYDFNDEVNIYDMSQYHNYEDVSILQFEEGTIKKRLEKFAQKDQRINSIISNYQKYPEELMESLSRNIELTSFVVNYFANKNKVYSDNIGIIDENIPELYQWDERWGYGKYGNSNIAISGCGPTSLAMVVAGLKRDNTITPYKVAKLSEEKGYYIPNVGTTWDLITKGGLYYGLNVKEISLSKDVIYNALENNHPIICSMRKGDFTLNGHFIVLAGIKNGKIKVNDPNSKIRSNYLWDYSRIKSQIKNLWEFSL